MPTIFSFMPDPVYIYIHIYISLYLNLSLTEVRSYHNTLGIIYLLSHSSSIYLALGIFGDEIVARIIQTNIGE